MELQLILYQYQFDPALMVLHCIELMCGLSQNADMMDSYRVLPKTCERVVLHECSV